MQYFGIAVLADGTVKVSKGRSTEAAATELSAKGQPDAERHFAVQAANGGEARKAGLEQALGSAMAEGGGLVEPTAEELAEAASAVKDRTVPGVVRAVRGRAPYWGVTVADGDVIVADVSHPTGEEALTDIWGIAGAEAHAFAVQAETADQAAEVAGADPTPASGEIVHLAPAVRGPRPSLDEVRTKPVEVEVYFVSGPGTVHSSAECRFVKGKADTQELVAKNAVRKIMGGGELKTEAGRRAHDYCRYCAVTSPASKAS